LRDFFYYLASFNGREKNIFTIEKIKINIKSCKLRKSKWDLTRLFVLGRFILLEKPRRPHYNRRIFIFKEARNMNVKETAAKYADYVVATRRTLHQHPEPSMKEVETCRYIKEALDSFGIENRVCGGTGVLGTLGGKKPGKCIMLRADMDALYVKEQTGLDYASRVPDMMHACGHDGHMAMLLTAAQMLKEKEDEIPGTIKLCFQPGEECGKGAPAMIDDGVLDGVDICFAIHLWADVPLGKVSVEAGPRMASCDEFRIRIKGKGCHGSAPQQGVDAAVTTAAVINNLQSIVSRETSPLEPAVVTVATIQTGTTWNVVAEDSYMTGTTRTFSMDIFDRLPDMITRIVKGTCDTYRAEGEVEYLRIDPPVINDPDLSAIAQESVKKIWGPEGNCHFEKITASEDFGHYLPKIPGVLAFVGVRNEESGACYPHHNGHFQIDESALLPGACLYVQTALDYLEANQ
jgi:amidohydrolase